MTRRKKQDYVDDEIQYDPEEKFDFDEGLPFTGTKSNLRRLTSKKINKDNRPPIGYGKYRDEIDFEEGLPEFKYKVAIIKAAAEVIEEDENVRVHKDKNVTTKIQSIKNENVPVRIHQPVVKKSTPKTQKVEGKSNKPIEKKIVSRSGKFCVESETTGRSFGCYDTKEQAVARLKQIEGFKKENEADLPYVLTWEAVKSEFLPDPGTSGLPKSLEQDVPPKFRFWKCQDQEDCLAVREALVEEGLFTKDTIRKVNGELRRAVIETVQKLYLPPVYDDSEAVEVPAYVKPIEKVSEFLRPSESEIDTVLFDESIVDVVGLDTILEKAEKVDGDYVIAVRDTEDNRKLLVGPVFKLKSRDDLLFVSNCELACERSIDWIQYDRSDELVKFALSEGRTIRVVKAEEERTVYGIVLEPDEIDSQKDTISAEEIKQACYKFMEDFGNLGKQHQEIVNGKLVLLENFIAPVDFEIDGQKVKKGSWLMKERVVDDVLWESVKKGEFTGFSIGGSGIRQVV